MTLGTVSCDNEIKMTTESRMSWGGLSPAARWAGFLGLLPFLLALGLVTVGASHDAVALGRDIALAWGAVILAFVAAVHWGLALASRWRWSMTVVVGSTLPSLVGAIAVLVGGERGIALLVVGFGLFWLFEHRHHADQLPADYVALRRLLTIGVCALLVMTAFAGTGVDS